MFSEFETQNIDSLPDIPVAADLERNQEYFRNIFRNCSDLVLRKLSGGLSGPQTMECLVVFLNGMVDDAMLNRYVLEPVMNGIFRNDPEKPGVDGIINMITAAGSGVPVDNAFGINTMKDAVKHIMNGCCVLFTDGGACAAAFDVRGWQSRSISDPKIESVIEGPQEAFTDDIAVNVTQLRRRLKTPSFKMERLELGRSSKTVVIVAYLESIAETRLLDEVRQRLGRIDVDIITDSGQIEQMIEDSPFSPFPQIEITERPDACVLGMSIGRVAVLTDGTPFAMIMPATFSFFLAVSEDQYTRFFFSSFIRLLRYMAFALSFVLPSLYIAITTFHQEMIPTPLLTAIAISRASIPFPAILEALFMEITFEILREAGERLPRTVGQALSIVGALVIGQTAIQAGIVSPVMVIIVALTGMASFAIPKFNMVRGVRLLRFPLMILAGTLGIFGVIMGLLVILIHLTGLRSFGIPYLSPIVPADKEGWIGIILKFPLWFQVNRPAYIQRKNLKREKAGLKPGPPS